MQLHNFGLLLCLIFLVGCNHDGGDSSEQPEPFSVGSVRSTDLLYLPLDEKFNSWLISTVGQSQQIMLKVKEELTPGGFNDLALWAMAVRKTIDQGGTVFYDEAEIKIFPNYIPRDDICCVNSRPFSDFDNADAAYVAVGGFINFNGSNKQASFDLDFQKETSVGSGVLEGPIVKVEGCWSIAGEGGVSGCEIGQF